MSGWSSCFEGGAISWLQEAIASLVLLWNLSFVAIGCCCAPTMAKAYSQIYNGKYRHLEATQCGKLIARGWNTCIYLPECAQTKRITYVNMKFCRFKKLRLGFLLTPQLYESAGGLPRLKLPLHSCSLTGSTSAMEVSIPIAFVLPGREHECNESFKLGRPPALSWRRLFLQKKMAKLHVVLVVRNDQKIGKLKIVGQCIRIVRMGEFENEGFILDDLYDNEEDGQHIDDGKQKRMKEISTKIFDYYELIEENNPAFRWPTTESCNVTKQVEVVEVIAAANGYMIDDAIYRLNKLLRSNPPGCDAHLSLEKYKRNIKGLSTNTHRMAIMVNSTPDSNGEKFFAATVKAYR
ncbi:hypothetical protein Tco_1243141, partial [Tanacetum coccineum]